MRISATDESILELCRDKDTLQEGFRLLVSTYSELLYNKIRRIVLTHDNANDVLQDTFLKIWLNINKFEERSKLSTWMYRIAVNESLSFLEKNKEKFIVDIDNPELGIENLLSSDSFFSGDELDIQFQKAIQLLPEKQKLVFLMKYYDDMKYSEISEILGTSVGALKASYHHAVTKIEEFIKNID